MLVPQTVDRPSSLRFPSYFSQNLPILHICFFASFRPCQAIFFYSQLATKSDHCFLCFTEIELNAQMCVTGVRCTITGHPEISTWKLLYRSDAHVRKKPRKKPRARQFSQPFLLFGVLYPFFFALTRRISHENFASHLRKGLTKLPCEAIAQLFPHVCGGLQKTCPATGIAGC